MTCWDARESSRRVSEATERAFIRLHASMRSMILVHLAEASNHQWLDTPKSVNALLDGSASPLRGPVELNCPEQLHGTLTAEEIKIAKAAWRRFCHSVHVE